MFGTSYVGFGSDPTYTQKIMKIPDIAWPTFFDSYRESMLSIKYVHGDLCKHLGIDSSTDHPDRHSNLFLNAYIDRHVHAAYLKNDLIL